MPNSLTPFSARCQLRGHLHCGECKCQSGYSGDFCECSAEASAEGDAAMLAQCTEYGVKEVWWTIGVYLYGVHIKQSFINNTISGGLLLDVVFL